jgi:arylformamidase
MLIDLSHTIEHEMITYRGLPGPVISDYLSREASHLRYAEGTEFQIGKIEMVANTGTYIDSPFHRYSDREDLAGLTLESIANLDGVLIRKVDSAARAITKKDLEGRELNGKAVLIQTGWDKHWRTDHYADGEHPFVTEEGAQFLVDSGAALVGIDSFNIDDTATGLRPAHTVLLKAGIPIVEHLCRLNDLPETGFRFFSVPPKVRGMGSFSVRAFAIAEE